MSLMADILVFLFKQKTAYEMRMSDWSSDVCSSDLGDYDDVAGADRARGAVLVGPAPLQEILDCRADRRNFLGGDLGIAFVDDRHPEGTGRGPGRSGNALALGIAMAGQASLVDLEIGRATSELQSLMRISYAVFCLKKKTTKKKKTLMN